MQNPQPFRTLIRAAWESTKGDRVRFFTFVFLYILAYTIDLLIPVPIGYMIGVLAKEGFTDKSDDQVLMGLGIYVALRLANTLLHHFGRFIQSNVSFSARMHTLSSIFSSLLQYPLKWHVKHHSGESLSRLHRATGAIDQTIGTYVWQIVEGLVKTSFAIIAIFALDFYVALSVLGMALVTIAVMVLFNKKLIKKIRANNAFYDRLNRTVVDYLVNVVTVKTLSLENSASHYLKAHRPEGAKIQRKIAKYMELKWGTTGVGYTLMMGFSLLLYFQNHRGLSTPMDVAQIYVLMNYLDKIFQAIGSFTGYYGGLIEASTAYEDAERILRESNEEMRLAPVPVKLKPWKTIHIKNIEFRYDTSELSGLKGLSFDIMRGDKIALVGPSGGGKSTFLKLIAGLLVPSQSEFYVDGSTVGIESICNETMLLPQEPEIFSESLKFNVTLDGDFSDEEISKIVNLCRIDRLIQKLPKKWETDLAEKGLNLSVGEKQRVAMARGLLRIGTRPILLLDEPTSSLDPKTEKEIFYDLLDTFSDRTIITACHRLAMVPLFNKIIYVREGKVEESGSFQELLDKKGAFALAWEDYQKKVVSGEVADPSRSL